MFVRTNDILVDSRPYNIVASHLTWGSVITVAVGHTNGGLGDCGLTMKHP